MLDSGAYGQENELWSPGTWVQIPALPFTSCMVGTVLCFDLLTCQTGIIMEPAPELCWRCSKLAYPQCIEEFQACGNASSKHQ